MYTKRLQLTNYGPIEILDIQLPFDVDVPKPVVLVGENGSGKSILLSHIVNGLIAAKNIAYPETPEIEIGKVYKIRSSSYIRLEEEYYFGRVDFDNDFFVSEICTRNSKRDYDNPPEGIVGSDAERMWLEMPAANNSHYDTNLNREPRTTEKVKDTISSNCVLYFPSNRFEEPPWLNEENLKYRAKYMNSRRLEGQTLRRAINYSPLEDNQNWLFDVVFDRSAFEIQQGSFPVGQGSNRAHLPLFLGYSGEATSAYNTALAIIRVIVGQEDIRFGIGRRTRRNVELILAQSGDQYAPSVFHLSSGETALLNLFMSLLRDFDLTTASFSDPSDIRGIAVVDEIDLHLHAVHQYEVLPKLIAMFPKVQFIVTTHAPLFVLGMEKAFGDNGFEVYRLPQGQQISPEEFSEFEGAYRAFVATRTFNADMRSVMEQFRNPIVFVEGVTDQRYMDQAAKLLDREAVLSAVGLRVGGGKGKLTKIWKDSVLPLTEILPYQVLLLFDCDAGRHAASKGKLVQRSIPIQDQNPIQEGIENMFTRSALNRAREYRPEFLITEEEHGGTDEHGQAVIIPEKWTVNESQKPNLCDWLCDNGTAEDFQHFQLVFDLIEEALDLRLASTSVAGSDAVH